MISRQVFAIFLFAFFCLLHYSVQVTAEEKSIYSDLISAAANHHHQGHGRVQIKVYRGPSEGHEHFAPHGYWVKQPADHYHHH